jgi:hypothetical protein
MECHEGPHTAFTIALNAGVYLAIIMVRYGGFHTYLIIALNGGRYLSIIMDRH